MKIEIIGKKENKLLKRVEVKAKATEYAATPKRKDVLEELSKKLGVNIENIAIKRIGQEFGKTESIVTANAYDSVDDLKKTETHVKVIESEGEKKEAKV